MGLGPLPGGGVGGLGFCCFPAAFAEGPARLFFAGGFANMSGLSSSRVVVLGEAVGSWGQVRFDGWADQKCVLSPVVIPKAGERLVRSVTSDHCAAARLLSTSLTLRGWTDAGGWVVGRGEERVSSWSTIVTEATGYELSSEVNEQANKSNE
jgi:hypothetical protein